MQFLSTPEGIYWEVDLDKMRLYNYNGGWHPIDENSEEWCNGEIIKADSWHDLYLKVGYCCLERRFAASIWLSPEGMPYSATAHLLTAQAICEVIYGVDRETFADDFLISRGWVKLTNSLMLDYYIKQGYYKHLTLSQRVAVLEWCKLFNIDSSFLT